MKRSLAAILVADTVGFSTMMGADEEATLAAFADMRHRVFEPSVARHEGEIVKRTGDGWLVEFGSALAAVDCAVDIQTELATYDRIKLRIGIHLGDVVHDDEGDIHGDGVNIAARMEGVSAPRGVAISDQVYNALDGTKKAEFGGGDARELKNIQHPVRVWAWLGATAHAADAPDAPDEALPVIFLDPLSLGGDVEVAADLAQEIQNGLENAISKRSGIRVSTSRDGGSDPAYVLHGRCRVSGSRCRVHLAIIVAANGETHWSTKIDGEIHDLFGFVDDVVWQVGAALRVHLNAHAGKRFADEPDAGLTGQQLLSKAAFHMHQFDLKSMAIARTTMAAAVAKQPENPMALAMHSYALMQSVPLAMERPEDIDVDEVLAIADRAVHFGASVDYAFHNRARIRLWLRGDHQGCTQDAERALAINPGFHFAREDLAVVDIFGANTPRGVASLEAVVAQLPDHPSTPYRRAILGIGRALLGDMDAALIHARDAYERKPMVRLHALAFAAAASGNDAMTGDTAFREMVACHGLSVKDAARFPFKDAASAARFRSILRRAGTPE